MIQLAIDTMGGDHAPLVVIQGLALFYKNYPECRFLLYGDQAQIKPLLENQPESLRAVCRIIHTDDVIGPETKPAYALRNLKNASMRLALQAVADQEANGALSAGNTGAYLALSKTILKPLGTIDRPAIASQIPTAKGESVFLDLGGTLQPSSRNLCEYAVMGDAFARRVLGIQRPTVGLLNVGKESTKGSDTLKQAFDILQSSPLNFVGFVEGNDIVSGDVSVIITDGFTGNIALKTAEGVLQLGLSLLKKCFNTSFSGRLVGFLVAPFLRKVRDNFNPSLYNGAIWLGLNGVAVKSHGGTDALGFYHALKMTYDMVNSRVDQAIEEAWSHWTGMLKPIGGPDVE